MAPHLANPRRWRLPRWTITLTLLGAATGCSWLAPSPSQRDDDDDASHPTARPRRRHDNPRPHNRSASATPSATTAVPAWWPAPNTRPGHYLSMRDAKRALRKLYRQQGGTTLYANCAFSHWRIDWSHCCYQPPSLDRKRLEWEHVVPASAFGRHLDAWRKGAPECRNRHGSYQGRRCARRASQSFRKMEADMHNLFPAIGQINEDRAYYPMAIIAGEVRRYGTCDVEIAHRQIEPRPAARGDIARSYLYMQWRYPNHRLLDDDSRALMRSWHRSDPITPFERERNAFITARQGVSNPWVR